MSEDPTLSDHDILIEIRTILKEKLEPLVEKNTLAIWGNGSDKSPGLIVRTRALETHNQDEAQERQKRQNRIYQVAGGIAAAVGAIVAVLARELMRHFGI
jgi:hypothetical protein